MDNGHIDFERIERQAQHLRAQAMRDGVQGLGRWLRALRSAMARRA